MSALPTDYDARKAIPLAQVLDYFPDAIVAIAMVIGAGQAQHGTTGWDRAKSKDEENTLLRHFLERGTIDTDGVRHSAKVAWRALALLQKEIEAARGDGKISRGSYDSSKVPATETLATMLGPDSLAARVERIAHPLLCEHANENPAHCPCDNLCYCKGRTCGAPCECDACEIGT